MLICPNCGKELDFTEIGEICTNCGVQIPSNLGLDMTDLIAAEPCENTEIKES